MGRIERKLERFKAQISELYRLAEEAELCATLLRQQAASHEEILAKPDLDEAELDKLLAEEPKQRFTSRGCFVVTEGLM